MGKIHKDRTSKEGVDTAVFVMSWIRRLERGVFSSDGSFRALDGGSSRRAGAFRLRGAAVFERSETDAAAIRSSFRLESDEPMTPIATSPVARPSYVFNLSARSSKVTGSLSDEQISTCVCGFRGTTRPKDARCDVHLAPAAGVLPPGLQRSIHGGVKTADRGIAGLLRPNVAETSHGPPRVL